MNKAAKDLRTRLLEELQQVVGLPPEIGVRMTNSQLHEAIAKGKRAKNFWIFLAEALDNDSYRD